MNALFLVGKVKNELVVNETSNGKMFGSLLIDVEKYYHKENEPIVYDTFQLTVWNNLDNYKALKEGYIVSIRCHLVSNNYVRDDSTIFYRYDIVADDIRGVSYEI